MKTIEEAAKEYANQIWGENYITENKNFHKDGFKAGVEFAERWIPVEEEKPVIRALVEIKNSNCYPEYSHGYFISGTWWNPYNICECKPTPTHWRPINRK